MNSNPFTDYIERTVSPVRASGWRKDRMREELAAHLAASWELERARGGDEIAAAERALRRMGEIGELKQSLQDSVPWLERCLFAPISSLAWVDRLDRALSPREGETPPRYAVRMSAWFTAGIAGAELIVVPTAMAINGRPPSDGSTTVLWAIAALVVSAIGSIVFTLLGAAMVRAIEHRRVGRARLVAYSVLSSVVAIALAMSFVLIVSLAPRVGCPFARSDLMRLVAASFFAPPLMVFAARESVMRRRRRDSWGLADIAP
jgi:hypothetical protein